MCRTYYRNYHNNLLSSKPESNNLHKNDFQRVGAGLIPKNGMVIVGPGGGDKPHSLSTVLKPYYQCHWTGFNLACIWRTKPSPTSS